MARLTKVCPQFPASDVSKAAAWYCDKLGFTRAGFYPEHGFAIVRRDDIEIHFWTCNERHIAEHTSAYVVVDDIDNLYATMAGAKDGGSLSEVANREWGIREFYVTDPDGNLLKFGVPALATAE